MTTKYIYVKFQENIKIHNMTVKMRSYNSMRLHNIKMTTDIVAQSYRTLKKLTQVWTPDIAIRTHDRFDN